MKRLFIAFIALLFVGSTIAQPPARKREAQKTATTQQQQKAVAVSERAQLEYPTAPTMPDDVAWRRDIYRIINLEKDKNAVLYYPQEPEGDKMNLFTYLFKLVMRRQITVYKHTMNGSESFASSNVMQPVDILKKFEIPYQERSGKFRIEDSDIPSADVKTYYVKESTYFDQHTATFRTQVTALCPVMYKNDEFGIGVTPNPMFWLKYSDVAPFLAKLELMASNYNNAAMISADDYFSTNKYEGEVYMTNNLQGNIISNEDSIAKAKAQKKIETELAQVERNVWGNDSTKKDSTSAAVTVNNKKAIKKTQSKSDEESTSSRSQLKRQRSGSSSSKSSSPKISVRRQRR